MVLFAITSPYYHAPNRCRGYRQIANTLSANVNDGSIHVYLIACIHGTCGTNEYRTMTCDHCVSITSPTSCVVSVASYRMSHRQPSLDALTGNGEDDAHPPANANFTSDDEYLDYNVHGTVIYFVKYRKI